MWKNRGKYRKRGRITGHRTGRILSYDLNENSETLQAMSNKDLDSFNG